MASGIDHKKIPLLFVNERRLGVAASKATLFDSPYRRVSYRPHIGHNGLKNHHARAAKALVDIAGSLAVERCVNQVVLAIVRPLMQAAVAHFLFRRTMLGHVSHGTLQSVNGINMHSWLPVAPVLFPMDHVWDLIGRELYRTPP